MSNLRITSTESQTAENIITALILDGRNTKRKRINSLKFYMVFRRNLPKF